MVIFAPQLALGMISIADTQQSTPTSDAQYPSADGGLDWTMILTVIGIVVAVVIPILLYWLQGRRENRRFRHIFRGGRWIKSTTLSYREFRGARPESVYLHLDRSESLILERIRQRKSIVILGPPLRGKTRIMVESLRQLDDASVLIPYASDHLHEIIVPRLPIKPSKHLIVVLDDLQLFFSPGKDLSKLLRMIEEKGWQIVATCRTEGEWKTVQRIWGVGWNILEPIILPEADSEVAGRVAALNGVDVPKHFDGRNIGTVFVNLDEMRLRYATIISNTQRLILIAIKKLLLAGIYNEQGQIPVDSVKVLMEMLPLHLTETEWLDATRGIIDMGFCSGTEFLLEPESVYFDLIVEPKLTTSEIVIDVVKGFPHLAGKVENLIYSARSAESAIEVIRALHRAGVALTSYHFNVAMSKQDSYAAASRIKDEMIVIGVMPNVITYGTLIRISENPEIGAALKMEMTKNGITPNSWVYNSLIHQCRRLEDGLALKDEMIAQGLDPNNVTYNILINLCSNLESGLKIKDEMVKRGVRLDHVTYGTLIKLSGDYTLGKALKAEMVRNGISPNAWVFNTLIKFCNDLEAGCEVKKEMTAAGVPADAITYNSLIGLCKELRDGMKLMREMIAEKINPDTYTCNRLIQLCGNLEDGLVIRDIFLRQGLKFNSRIYNSLINLCRDLETGRGLKDEMLSKGIAADPVTFNMLINLCIDYPSGSALKDEMERLGIVPDIVTFGTLSKKVASENEAIAWITELCATKLIPNTFIIGELRNIIPLVIDSPRLLEMFSRILSFNPKMFFSWLDNFSESIVKSFVTEYPADAASSDFVKLGFSHFYLRQGNPDAAKEFLDECTGQNYYYHLYSADYWRQINDGTSAENSYRSALGLATDDNQSIMVYEGLASLIKEYGLIEKYPEAMEFCRRTVRIHPENAGTAKQLLTYFTIVDSEGHELIHNLETLRAEYRIGKKTIRTVLPDIADVKKKDAIVQRFLP